MYRTYTKTGGERKDAFVGYCRYKDRKLLVLHGDGYSLNDEIEMFEYVEGKNEPYLCVWYKSE